MITSSFRSSRRQSVAGFTSIACIAAGFAVARYGATPALAMLALGATVYAAAVVREEFLPSLALVAFVAAPVKYLPAARGGYVSLASVVLVVWLLRRSGRGICVTAAGRLAIVSSLTIVALAALAGVTHIAVVGWSVSFLTFVVLPILLLPSLDQPKLALAALNTAWISCGAALGLYACLERFVFHSNPLFDRTYEAAVPPLVQAWSVYRPTTTLGHPLMNGMFFATALTLAIAAWVSGERTTWLKACTGLVAVALVLTASRGSLIGAACGISVVLLARSTSSQRLDVRAVLRGALVLALVVLLAYAVGGSTLETRLDSAEGQASSQVRTDSISAGLRLVAQHPLTGVGPGMADEVKRSESLGDARKSGLENSWLQLLVALGVPVGALVLLMFVVAASKAFGTRAPELGALVAIATCAFGFNFLEGHWPGMLVLGLSAGACAAAESA